MGGRSTSQKGEWGITSLLQSSRSQLGTLISLSQLWSVLEHNTNFTTAKNVCFWNKSHLFSVVSLILMNDGLFLLLADVPWKGTHVIQCQRRAAWNNFRGTLHCVFTYNKEKKNRYVSHCSNPKPFQGESCLKEGLHFACWVGAIAAASS